VKLEEQMLNTPSPPRVLFSFHATGYTSKDLAMKLTDSATFQAVRHMMGGGGIGVQTWSEAAGCLVQPDKHGPLNA